MKRSVAAKFFVVVAVLVTGFGALTVTMAWLHVGRHAYEQLDGRSAVLQRAERTLGEALKNQAGKPNSSEMIDDIARDFTQGLAANCGQFGMGVPVVRCQLGLRELRELTGPKADEAFAALFDADTPTSPSERRWTGDLTIANEPCEAMVLPSGIQPPGDPSPRVHVLGIPHSDLHARMMRELRNQATTGIGTFMLAMICVFIAFHRMVSRRLGAIADHFTALAANPDNPKLEPLPVRSDDEIGRIASSFNVLNQIMRTNRERLDTLVQRRTEVLNRLATAVTQAAEAIILTDKAGVIQYVNPAFERITGFSPADVIGLAPELIRSDHHDEAFYQNIWNTVNAGRIWSGRITKKRKDGSVYEQDTTVSPIRDSAGNIDGFVALGRDISSQVALEQQLRQSQKMEAVGRLAGGIAHDFNNLLTVINGYCDLLVSRLGREHPHLKDVIEIKRAGERAGSLTRQLLAFSRRQVLQPRLVDLNRLIGDMENMLRRLIGEDIELIVSPARQIGKIIADPGQIEQVILNLAVNARDAMPNGGRIVLTTANMDLDHAPFVVLSIADTGHGMGEETIAHIFEPFFTTKEMGKGTGLGLSTVYGIVKQSGGDIRVCSAPGRGTTFHILLPRLSSGDEGIAVVDNDAAPAGGNENILVVEDDELVRMLVETILQKAGYSVLSAADGIEGLEVFRKNPEGIDLVMTDLVMPKLGGRGLVEKLSAEHGPLRVLYMSGYSDEEVKRHGELQAGSHFIGKPFAAHEMLEKVRDAIKSNKAETVAASTETNPDH